MSQKQKSPADEGSDWVEKQVTEGQWAIERPETQRRRLSGGGDTETV